MSKVIYKLWDIDAPLVAAWSKYFAEIPQVRPSVGDIFSETADAIIVSQHLHFCRFAGAGFRLGLYCHANR